MEPTARDAGCNGLRADCTWSGAAQFGGGLSAQQPAQGTMGQAAQCGGYGVPQKSSASYGAGQQGAASGFGRSGAARPAAGAAAGGVAGAGQPAGSYGRASITPAGGAGAPQAPCPAAGLPRPLLLAGVGAFRPLERQGDLRLSMHAVSGELPGAV